MNLDRTIILLGKNNLDKIVSKHILIVGIGGVGGYTLESLVRMGIENITIVDYDKIEDTNLNRQIISNLNNIGNYKVDEAYKRYTSINSNLKLNIIKDKLTKDNLCKVLRNNYDFIVDACDDIVVKVELIKYALKNNIKIISSMGTAKRIDATKLVISTLDKTKNDPLAKKLRTLLRSERISLKIPVIFSLELPIKTNEKELGSISYVPGTAGLFITSYIINTFLNE